MNRVRAHDTGPAVSPLPERSRPSALQRPLWWANLLASAVLMLTYLAPHVDPVTSWVPSVLAMSFTYQLLVHLGFLAWWAMFRRKRMLLSGAMLLLGYDHIGDHVQLFGRSAPNEELRGKPFKVMSYNVRLFDLYNWSKNKQTRDAIFDIFHKEDPDILCLQEFFYSSDRQFFHTKTSLLNDFRFVAAHERYSKKARYDQHFGIATFSSMPIVDKGHIDFPDNPENLCIWSDIALPEDTIRVYNAHLASYHFGDADYRFIKELDTGTNTDTLKQGGLRILKRLKRGFRLRADEVRRIAGHMRQSPHPVLYCGDMNDVPMSYGYALLREELNDAFVESGTGLGGTYIGDLPSLRIDHIMHGDELESWDFTTIDRELSDHRAITTLMGSASR